LAYQDKATGRYRAALVQDKKKNRISTHVGC
jgi:hypothetical protein